MPPESIDLGNNPTGTAPTNEQITQIKSALGIDTDLTQAKARANHTGTQSIGTVSGLTEELASLDNNKVDTSSLSTTGGASKVTQLDASGNLYLAPLIDDATAAAEGGGPSGEDGNLILRNGKFVGWYASDGSGIVDGAGTEYAKIRYDRNHSGGGEWNFDASSRVCWYWNGGWQFGNANGGDHFIYLHCGYASSGNTMRQSVPFHMLTKAWNGSASVDDPITLQAAPLDTSGTNAALKIFAGATLDSGTQEVTTGTKIAEVARAGVWSAGTAPTFTSLTDGATITLTCSKYKTVQNAKVTLGGNRTLAVSGAEAGMRGTLYVKQDATGSRSLTLPTNSAVSSSFALSTSPGQVDRLSWEYDGSYYYWTIQAGLEIPFDTDASAFFTAASITDYTQKTAVNDFVLGLKSNSLWSKFYAIYPFVGGNATAHSKDLKGAYNITWSGTVTHDANGVTGNGTTGYGTTGVNLSTLGALNSASGYAYCRTATPTDGGNLFGAIDSGNRFGIRRSGSNMVMHGPNSTSISSAVAGSPDFRKHWSINRSTSTAAQIYGNSTTASDSATSTSAPNYALQILAWNSSTGAGAFTNANLAMVAFGQSLTSGEWATFRGLVDAYQTALGRANP